MKDRNFRKLVIKVYPVRRVVEGEKLSFREGILTIPLEKLSSVLPQFPLVKDVKVSIIEPGAEDRFINTIMDIIPIATKALGRLGEGITHAMTGAYVMLTGVDADGTQVANFGSSEGMLSEKLIRGRAGTPADSDTIIHVDITLQSRQYGERPAVTQAHQLCDRLVQWIRDALKDQDPQGFAERHEFIDRSQSGKKRVAIVKMVGAQGAMYDNQILPAEPAGMKGGRSIIDMGAVPIVLSPNEYRDGALRALT